MHMLPGQEPQTSIAHLMVSDARQCWAPGRKDQHWNVKAGWITPTFLFCVSKSNGFDTAL